MSASLSESFSSSICQPLSRLLLFRRLHSTQHSMSLIHSICGNRLRVNQFKKQTDPYFRHYNVTKGQDNFNVDLQIPILECMWSLPEQSPTQQHPSCPFISSAFSDDSDLQSQREFTKALSSIDYTYLYFHISTVQRQDGMPTF